MTITSITGLFAPTLRVLLANVPAVLTEKGIKDIVLTAENVGETQSSIFGWAVSRDFGSGTATLLLYKD